MNRHKFTKEENDFLIENVKGITLAELTKRFNEKFNTNLSTGKIANKKNKLHLTSGITGGQFKKGHISHNKGKTWNEFMSKQGQKNSLKTCFKKGHINFNLRPVGSERISKDGYIEIKVAEPNKWKTKHTYLFEKENGPVPKGHKVIFLDGDKRNFNLDNLKLISNAEHLVMNRYNLRYKNKELTEVSHTLSKIIVKQGKLNESRKNRL